MKIDNILKNFDLIEDKEIAKLEEINFKYPFFQTGQILLSKGLLNINSIDMMSKLKKPPHTLETEKNFFHLSLVKKKTIK